MRSSGLIIANVDTSLHDDRVKPMLADGFNQVGTR